MRDGDWRCNMLRIARETKNTNMSLTVSAIVNERNTKYDKTNTGER